MFWTSHSKSLLCLSRFSTIWFFFTNPNCKGMNDLFWASTEPDIYKLWPNILYLILRSKVLSPSYTWEGMGLRKIMWFALSHMANRSWIKWWNLYLLTPVQYHVMSGGTVVKNLPASAGDTGSIPGSGRSPGGGKGNPLQYPCWEISWTEEPGGYSPWVAKSRTGLSDQARDALHGGCLIIFELPKLPTLTQYAPDTQPKCLSGSFTHLPQAP